jgi:hypothetical protein
MRGSLQQSCEGKGPCLEQRELTHSCLSGTVSQGVQALVSVTRPRKRAKNEAMPPEALLDNAWRSKAILTLFQWAGTQCDPWILGDTNIHDALRNICEAVYGNLDLGLDDVEEDTFGKHPSFTRSNAFRLVCSYFQRFIVLLS